MTRTTCVVLLTAGICLSSAAAKVEKAVEADEEGNVVETAADRLAAVKASGPYRMVPLGPEGHLKLDTQLKNKATYRSKTPFRPGLRLFGAGGKDAVIVAQHGPETQRIMNELRWHLEKMIGRDVRVVPKFPTDDTPALTVKFTSGPFERSVVRQEGNVLFIEGSDAVGMSHALTYVLEALGFRYLWPGPLGKVIPKKADVYLPEGIALDYVPELKVVRRIRSYYSIHEARVGFCDKLGLDVLKVNRRKRQAGLDDPENRSFFAWHGINDSQQVVGPEPSAGGAYRWEHRFNDYYERFGKEHPDWFALQVNGSRDQDNRPCFCMSNEGLIDQMAKETIEMIDREPGVVAHSLCLPDGGYRSFCLCENCRKMDPKNAPVREGKFYYPTRRPMIGYSFTDRVLAFKNAIIERVMKARPGKKLAIYVYSSYVEPPKAVTPNPDFLIISVAGGNYCSTVQRAKVLESLAAWGTFGNPFVWRPNALAGFRPMMPQNAGRWLFEDVETLKANGLVGTDFDCYNGAWATDGMTFYMLSKAHLNPDRLTYDDLLADYCTAAFGAAAPAMAKYYDALSDYYAAAAARMVAAEKTEAKDVYVRGFDIPAFERLLDEADGLAAGDADALARIRFVRRGLELAKWEKRNSEAAWAKAGAAELAKIRRGYAEFVLKTYDEEPLAISQGAACFRGAELGPDPLGLKAGRREAAAPVWTRTRNGVAFKGVEVHNAVELVPTNGLWRFRRVSARAQASMTDRVSNRAFTTTGVELRFRLRSDEARIVMGSLDPATHLTAQVYCGDVIVDWPGTTRTLSGTETTWVFRKGKHANLRRRAEKFGCRYDPDVIRIVLPSSDKVGLRDVIGDVEPPPPELLPRQTYLAYGSSITHGSDALLTQRSYVSLVGEALGADVRNVGLAGAAWMQPEMADFIAGEAFDFCTLEMGVNALGSMAPDEYERRVRYMVRRVAESHPKARILAIDVYRAELSGERLGKARAYREILARVVRELALPNVAHVNGLDALPEKGSLSTGSLHPSPQGHEAIAAYLVSKFREFDK